MYEEISRNKRNSLLLIAVFCLVVMGIGYLVSAATGSPAFLAAAFVFAVVFSLNGYYFGDRMVLLASRAREADPVQYRQLYNVVEELTLASGLPMPKLYIIADDDAPNAFATGRDPEHASIAVTTALLERLNREELQGVLAHELSHVGNRDILFATLVGVLVGIIALLCDFFLRYTFWGGGGRRNRSGGGGGGNTLILVAALVLAVLAPIAAKLIQLAISRQREYLADAAGAKMTRNPEGLARALEKIALSPGKLEAANRATQHLYFVN
ncbi:MAG TPA: M48 family metallopeptidase, partial [bacterium]|nr:M48 family metallopeptidase [bacterium]